MHDVFISYESHSKNIADAICSTLERNKIRCWYAPRDVGTGTYAASIIDAIKNSKVFVLVLNQNASESPHVLNEVETAYKRIKDGLTIIPFKISDNVSEEMEYYVKRIHWIDAMTESLETSIDKLKQHVAKLVGLESEGVKKGRIKNNYMECVSDKEADRLRCQITTLEYFASDVYDKLVSGRNGLRVLDLGSNRGEQIMNMLGKRPEVEKVIGIDISEEAVKDANEAYTGTCARFYLADCESETFESTLKGIMKENGVEAFDIVNMSHLLHNLKCPFKALKVAKKVLCKDGTFVIFDVDDGQFLAYPDPDGIFARSVEILGRSETSGYRSNGRETHSLLKKVGMRNITLEKNGLNTAGMPFEIKECVYKMYIGLVPIVISESIANDPENPKHRADHTWISENMDELEQAFFSEEFFMNIGFMVYTAK